MSSDVLLEQTSLLHILVGLGSEVMLVVHPVVEHADNEDYSAVRSAPQVLRE
jgi:hypothetical protein